MEKITQLEAYCGLMKLFSQNASDEEIANLAFDFYNRWADANSKESYDTIYDIALIGEPGMELTREEIRKLIRKLYDIDSLIVNKAKNITKDFGRFSQFIMKIEEDDYLKSKHSDAYQDLMDSYFFALTDCNKENKLIYGNWKSHQPKVFSAIKRFFSANPYLLIQYVNQH